VKALAWPVAAFTIALMFRREIRAILSRIRKAALPGGVSIDFQNEIREAQELATQIEPRLPPPDRPQASALPLTEANARMLQLGLQPTPSGLDLNYYRLIAAQDPTLALAGVRIELEILAKNLAKGFKFDVPRNSSLGTVLRRLRDAGAITAGQLTLAQKVLSLANQAVHGRRVSREEAEEIIGVAEVLVDDYLSWLSWGFGDGWVPPADK